MTEEEKQKRSDECTAEEFANRLTAACHEVFELYSIATRLSDERTVEFSDKLDVNGNRVSPVARTLTAYARDLENALCF
jgi:hypothetical protein